MEGEGPPGGTAEGTENSIAARGEMEGDELAVGSLVL